MCDLKSLPNLGTLNVSCDCDREGMAIAVDRGLDSPMLFVSEDLAVVGQVSDRVALLQRGRIVGLRAFEARCDSPEHEYTKHLLRTAPRVTVHSNNTREPIDV